MTDPLTLRMTAGEAIAREAGALARDYFLNRSTLEVSFKGHQDYLTEADVAVENLIRGRLAELFSGDTVIGEEGGGEDSERVWVIDPIDGTANFARGEHHFAVSIAYIHEGRMALGFIYEPMTHALYCARRGRGATLDGKPIRVSDTRELDHARVELPYSRTLPIEEHAETLISVVRAGCEVRLPGSAALGLARVADGRLDAYVARSHNPWDVLAGLLLVQEAGGVINDFLAGGGVTRRHPVFAAAAGIAPAMAALMKIELTLA